MPAEGSDLSRILLSFPGQEEERTTLPGLLKSTTRSPRATEDKLINEKVVEVTASFDLSARLRSAGEEATVSPETHQLIALEARDGSTFFVRADRFREEIQRLYPDAVKDGKVDLGTLAGRTAASRGLGDWFWSKLLVITLNRDAIITEAEGMARQWLTSVLKEKFSDAVEKAGLLSASWLGAKALMWAIESKLAGEQGLYRWQGGELKAADFAAEGDARLARAAEEGLLILIHGTGSHTLGSFKDLSSVGSAANWRTLEERFQDRIYGFDHRTFSESPIDNTLMLAMNLPKRAKISLVTHSRGGLVGDLLCLQDLSAELISAYRRDPPTGKREKAWEKVIREQIAAEEQEKLRKLVRILKDKEFQIERYVRVACPAGGTRLLSDNLDLFLSGLLSLTSTCVGALLGPGASPVLSVLKRIVLEIADKRIDPRLVPGIEAMLTDAPMASLLAQAKRRPEISMGVIAGDIEGGALLQRMGVLFTDWMFFDRMDNDLIVDTASMYGGVAVRVPGTRYLFDQGEKVNHFNYFQNRRSLTGLQAWLRTDPGRMADLDDWTPIDALGEPAQKKGAEARAMRRTSRGEPQPDTKPVVILLPGIMGSHLEVRSSDEPGGGDRVWFDFFDIARGGFDKIRFDAPGIRPECLFEMYYGSLVDYLAASHWVIPFPFDWRRKIEESADALSQVVEKALDDHPNQPVRLLAHSMGGLVARSMIARHPDLWDRIVKHPGGRLIMMGTPNSGSHLAVETLLGKSRMIRQLAVVDTKHRLQGVLDIVAGFPGAVQLLPRPGFRESGRADEHDYFNQESWKAFQGSNRDRWFGDGICGIPPPEILNQARELWEGGITKRRSDDEGWKPLPILPTDRLAYVYGQDANTPCGVTMEGGRLKMVGTGEGDGTVTWVSGRLDFLPEDRCWSMPVDHGSLMKTPPYFPAILDLLETGETLRLGRLPVTRGAVATRTYEPGPVAYPTAQDLEHSLMGTRPVLQKPAPSKRTLKVRVRAMDLRYSQNPILCGHYLDDPIAGAESQIDKHLVGGRLGHREHLGIYAGDIGTAAVVVDHERRADRPGVLGRGAIIVGLGEWGALTPTHLTETVRAGVLNYLMLTVDQIRRGVSTGTSSNAELQMGSLLLGYNSTVNIGIEDSVSAVVRGVCEANRQFEDAVGPLLRIGELEFVELFLDTAISAAKAVRGLPTRLERDLKRLEIQIDGRETLIEGEGLRTRLSVSSGFGYWPRMIVTDADRPEAPCPPECYRIRRLSPIPVEMQEQLVRELTGNRKGLDEDAPKQRSRPAEGATAASAGRMKFVFMSQRARAEAIIVQRQPGLAESLIQNAIRNDQYRPELSRTLFQLLVPLDFKEVAREAAQMILVLDSYTANLPWEMLCAKQEPMVVQTAVVRQLQSPRFRRRVQSTSRRTACVIADPSTADFEKHFVTPSGKPLRELEGAAEEGDRIRELLTEGGYDVVYAPSDTEGMDVFNRLFQMPYRILVIAAHGVFEAETLSGEKPGQKRTGVVLSGGMLLTATEVSQMEVVPEVVFLNCCHLGKMDETPAYNRLAYSLSRELIEMGVRCVVAAGWAVNDRAAFTFAETFFDHFVKRGESFGTALHIARRTTYEKHTGFNTWGAYQAYGDPGFRLDHERKSSEGDCERFVAPQELIEHLDRIRNEVKFLDSPDLEKTRAEVERLLSRGTSEWKDLPAVLVAVGAVYAEFGPVGFDKARSAYLRAIAEEDKAGAVPVKTIEQLANLEARTSESLEDAKEGLVLADKAIARLEALMRSTAERPEEESAESRIAAPLRPNLERWSILGSALKRKAAIQVKAKADASDVRETLEAARNAYANCEGDTEDSGFNPYAMINRLQFDALLGKGDRAGRAELSNKCKTAAERRFAGSYDFFDAVMEVDAEVARRLLSGTLTTTPDEVAKLYREIFARVPKSAGKRDSVLKHLRLFGGFFEVLSRDSGTSNRRKEMHSIGESLNHVADLIQEVPSTDQRTTEVSTMPGDASATSNDGSEGTAAVAASKETKSKPAAQRSGKSGPPRAGKKKN